MPLDMLIDRVVPVGQNGGDIVVYRIIVTAMGVALLTCLVAIAVLTALHVDAPPTFGTIAGAIVGSFSTMLMPSPRAPTPQSPQPQSTIVQAH